VILLSLGSVAIHDIAVVSSSSIHFLRSAADNLCCCSSIKPHFHRLVKLLQFVTFEPYPTSVEVGCLNRRPI
jgi:hypothetical protein